MTISATTQGLRPGVCTSSNRPVTPFEGQMIYETDTDMVAIWNGSAWRYIAATTPTNGTVLQVVTATHSTAVANSTTTYADTGLTATITPKSSSSKILVLVNHSVSEKSAGDAGNGLNIQLHRQVGAGSFSNVYQVVKDCGFTNSALRMFFSASNVFLDTPSSTSALTYKTMFANRVAASTVEVQTSASSSFITLMEVAG
jgi:hypothetical protein